MSAAGRAKRALCAGQKSSSIGLGHGGDPGEAQLLGQALLQGPEHALRAAPGLRRIGRDQLDAELRQGPADLGRVVLVHTACLGRVPVVRGPIGVERAEQPVFGDHLAEPAERAHRALLGNEEARIDLRCRIVHGHDQVPPLARNPLVARAVLVQHHPHHRSARPLPAVRSAPGRRLDLAVRLQAQAKPVVAQPKAMLADQLLVEVLGREVRVARLEQHPHHLVHRRAARRDPPKAPVVQTLGTLGLAPASAGTSAPTCPGSPRPRPGSNHPDNSVRRHPRTSSISVPATAPSGASDSSRFGGNLKPDRSSVT